MFLIGVLWSGNFLIGDRFLYKIGEVGSSLAVEVSGILGAGPLPVGFRLFAGAETEQLYYIYIYIFPNAIQTCQKYLITHQLTTVFKKQHLYIILPSDCPDDVGFCGGVVTCRRLGAGPLDWPVVFLLLTGAGMEWSYNIVSSASIQNTYRNFQLSTREIHNT